MEPSSRLDTSSPVPRVTAIVKKTPNRRHPISIPLRNPQKSEELTTRKKQTDTPEKARHRSGGANCKNHARFAPPDFEPPPQPAETLGLRPS